jgi:hypothetical protein
MKPLSCVRAAYRKQRKFRAARAPESLCKWESNHHFKTKKGKMVYEKSKHCS